MTQDLLPSLLHIEQSLRERDFERARSLASALVDTQPGSAPAAWFALGLARQETGVEGAEAAFARAFALDPDLPQRRFAIANADMEQGRVDSAILHFHALTSAYPAWTDAWVQLGQCMLRKREYGAAYNIARHAASQMPTDAKLVELQVLALEYAGARPERVLPLRRELAQLQPESAPQQFLLAITASRVGHYAEMHAALDRALHINPDLLPAQWAKFLTPHGKFFQSRAAIDSYVRDWDSGCAAFAARDLEAPAMRHRLEGLLLAQCNFHLAYTGIDVTSRQLALGRILRRMSRAAFPQFNAMPVSAPLAGRRLRVGFLTATLRRHTVLKLFAGLLRGLPRDRFEVCAYALEAGSDELTEQLRGEIDLVRTEIGPLASMAQRIRDDRCDALVYIDIGMHPRSVAMAAMRLAPFQAMLWGHPISSGLDSIDAYISSEMMEPANAANHYSEALHTLPGLGCWYDPAGLRLQPADLTARVDTRLRLVCAQSGQKLLPEQDAVFARILAATPTADLVLLTGLAAGLESELVQRMRPHFAAAGVDFERRVRVVGHCDERQFLGELWQADLVLDTLGWSGGVTALETFWGDVPILTVAGEFMRARHTFAMLRLMDLGELIATDAEDYVARASALLADADERDRLRRLIGERKHRLYRDDRVVDAFAQLLEREVLARAD